MKEVVLLVIVLFPLSIPSSSEAEAKQVNGFSIDLIHRDSPLSPFYNSSMTQSEILINAAFRSISRMKSFNYFTNGGNNAETILIPNGGDYLMNIFIGTPPVQALASADTGSDLVWVQCLPCQQCYQQRFPIFDPNKSTTHEPVSCHSDSCTFLRSPTCGPSSQCKYEELYMDNSFTVGELATDTISLSPNGKQLVTYPNTMMGCGHVNVGNFKSTEEGIVGLGNGPLSLVSQIGDQIGHKFSYCLLPSYTTFLNSKLKFGSESTISRNGAVSTPLVPKFQSTFYYLTLEGLSIGGKVVKTEQRAGNIVIDSGTSITMLPTSFYNIVEAAVIEAIGDVSIPVREPVKPFKLCYKDGTIKDLPDITFQFSGAELKLQKMHTFGGLQHMICLLIIPTDGTPIFGNLQQVFFEVEYDLQQKMVSFTPSPGCITQ